MKNLFTILIAITMLLIWNCEDPNEAPTVSAITLSDDAPFTGETITLTSTATDPEGDALTISWSAAQGTFNDASLAEVEWTAPEAAAVVTVTVTYSDGTNESSQSVDINVGGLPALAYVGSATCGDCHTEIYADFIQSGHPYKFNIVDGGPPTYPDFVDNHMELPASESDWSNIAGIIGGFGWKMRFVDKTGHVLGTTESMSGPTGQNQHNFFEGYDWGWVDYDVDHVKPYNYNCFKCHTTGAVATTNPDSSWLKVHLDIDAPETMDYFEFGGVQCEACHGQGSQHAAYGNSDYIQKIATSRLEGGNNVTNLCGDCHTRNADRSIAVSGGKVKHHEQFDEFTKTAHYNEAGMECTTCHDPHKRAIWDGDAITTNCTSCHTNQTVNHAITECSACHMPYTAKSGISRGTYVGDVQSHLWAINTDTTYEFLSDDGATVRTIDGKAMLSLKYVCYGCHEVTGDDSGLLGGHESSPGVQTQYSAHTLTELAAKAATIHP